MKSLIKKQTFVLLATIETLSQRRIAMENFANSLSNAASSVEGIVKAFWALDESQRPAAKKLAADSHWAWRLFAHGAMDAWPQKAEKWDAPQTPLGSEYESLSDWEVSMLLSGGGGKEGEVKGYILSIIPPKEGLAVPIRDRFVLPDGSIVGIHGAPAREVSFEVPHPDGWIGSKKWYTGERESIIEVHHSGEFS